MKLSSPTIRKQTQQVISVLGIAALSATSALAQARVITVDNNPGSVAMFKDLNEAINAANDGDTLLLAGSEEYYRFYEMTKRLHLVGNGYFLDNNGIPGISRKSAKIANFVNPFNEHGVHFRSDSGTGASAAGSTLTGLEVWGLGTTVPITIDRCWTVGGVTDTDTVSAAAGSGVIGGRITMRRSYAHSVDFHVPGSLAINCIISYVTLRAGTSIANCVLEHATSVSDQSSIINSIFTPSSPWGSVGEFRASYKGQVTYSMAIGGNFLPEGNGIINGVASENDVFLGSGVPGQDNEVDNLWQLKPGSPAIGKGFNGVDMGAFGGAMPYILSGVPSRPRISNLTVPPVGDNATGLRFEVSSESF